ncbi:MAG: 50S ribosomal protein L21 [Patescibacteria group bacterium]|nr:50S ribosomal protein L21 [Patescibacteria group bacterium]
MKTGGKQYLVEEGRYYNFEKLPEEEGKTVTFTEVLLTIDGKTVKIGKPIVEAKVTGKVLSQFKDDKVKVFKYKKRKRYRKTYGHRQPLTKVEIVKIG